MSSLNTFLDGLFRSYVNGWLPGIKRATQNDLAPAYSQVWLKRIEDPLQQKGMDRAKSLYAVMQGVLRVIAIIFGSNLCRVTFEGEEEKQEVVKNMMPGVKLTWNPVIHRPSGYSFYDAVDVITGSAIHQAAHLREGMVTKPFEDIDEEEQRKVLEILYHLVLDVLHDQIVTTQYPGYEGYLLKHRHYLLNEKLLKQWGQKSHTRVNLLYQALRSTEQVPLYKRNVQRAYFFMLHQLSNHQTVNKLRKLDAVVLARQVYTILFDEKAFTHTRELNYMSERFVMAEEGLPTPGENGKQKGGKRNQSKDGKHRRELQKVEAASHVPITGALLKELREDHQDLVNPLEMETGELVPLPAGESVKNADWNSFLHQEGSAGTVFSRRGLKRQDIENMKRLKDEEYTNLDHTDAKFRYQIWRQTPKLTPDLQSEYEYEREAIQSYIVLLRNQWSWSNTKRVMHQYGLKSGRLDEDALFQAKYSQEVFMNPIIENTRTRQLDVVLLIDSSSSMYEQAEGTNIPKYRAARQLAALFVESLEPVDSVQTWVYSFMQESTQSVLLQELFTPRRNARKERIAALRPGRRTPEYEALLAVSKLVENEGRQGVQKVLLVLSDGQPGDDMIPYHVQKKKIKELVTKLQNQGFLIIQLALGPEALSKEMYSHFVPFPKEGYRGLVIRFGKLLKSLL